MNQQKEKKKKIYKVLIGFLKERKSLHKKKKFNEIKCVM